MAAQKKKKGKNTTFNFNNVVENPKKENKDIGPPDVRELQKKVKEDRAPNRKVME